MEKEKIESFLIIAIFYIFIILSAILVSMRFNQLSREGYSNNNSNIEIAIINI